MPVSTFHVMTLFPEMFDALRTSVLGRAEGAGIIGLKTYQIRDFSADPRHKNVDDYTYGGGAGLLMMCQPIFDCYKEVMRVIEEENTNQNEIKNNSLSNSDVESTGMTKEIFGAEGDDEVVESSNVENKPSGFAETIADLVQIENKNFGTRILYPTPQGIPFTQEIARDLAQAKDIVILCGRYEGVDERVLDAMNVERYCLGDYVLTGGELPAMTIIDCVSRLIPGVLHNEDSPETESFDNGLLEYPQYTRPATWSPEEGTEMHVPEILLSGDHGAVDQWRLEQQLERTRRWRPDLYEVYLKNMGEKS